MALIFFANVWTLERLGEASGLRPMIKTAGVELSESWTQLFEGITKKRVCYGLSRFARWASQRQIAPPAVDAAIVGRFISDLEAASLTRISATYIAA